MKHFIFFPFVLLFGCGTLQKDSAEITQISQDATQEIVNDLITELAKRKAVKPVPAVGPVSSPTGAASATK